MYGKPSFTDMFNLNYESSEYNAERRGEKEKLSETLRHTPRTLRLTTPFY